jgi:hypothetical protein
MSAFWVVVAELLRLLPLVLTMGLDLAVAVVPLLVVAEVEVFLIP